MTATTHPGTTGVRRSSLQDAVRQPARPLTTLVGRFRAKVAAFAASGQLGPDPEKEIGRWTGTRT
jgi:hypothetical protein